MVHLEVSGGTSAEVTKALREREVDIGIYAGEADTEQLEAFPCHGDRLVLICPKEHALSQFQEIEFVQALGYRFVGSISATAIDGLLSRAAAEAGTTLDVTTRASGFETLCSLVADGLGVCVLPELIALRHARALEIRIVRLRDSWATRQFTVAISSWATLTVAGQRFLGDLQGRDLSS